MADPRRPTAEDITAHGAGKRRPKADDMPQVFARMLEGLSLRKVCDELGLDPPSTLHFIEADDRLRHQYALARAVRGDEYGVQVALIAAAVAAGKMKPEAGRVAMDGFKWTAARMAAKGWGDKVSHELSGPGGGPIQHDLSKLTDQQLEKLEELLAIAGGAAAERDKPAA